MKTLKQLSLIESSKLSVNLQDLPITLQKEIKQIKPCCEKSDIIEAIKNGHLECLKYAHDQKGVLDENTCVYSVRYNRLKCLKYLYKNGCPLNENVCIWAARLGHFKILKYNW
jgi:hypothetical protein